MPLIKDLFAKNGNVRNVIFVISFTLWIVLVVTYLLMGHKFLYTAPALILLTLSGLYFKPPSYYLPLCVGAFLQFGLFSALMIFLIIGPIMPVFIDFIIGCIGFVLIIISVWQAVFGEWNLPQWTKRLIQVVTVVGLILSIIVVAIAEYHGIKPVETPHYKTY